MGGGGDSGLKVTLGVLMKLTKLGVPSCLSKTSERALGVSKAF